MPSIDAEQRDQGEAGARKSEADTFFNRRPPLDDTIGAAINSDDKRTVFEALGQGGFENASEGIREIMLAYRDSTTVRDAVARYRRDTLLPRRTGEDRQVS